MVIADRVDRNAGQQRDEHGHHHRAGGEGERPRDLPTVRTQEREESPEDLHGLLQKV
jgi:hypothetical protein